LPRAKRKNQERQNVHLRRVEGIFNTLEWLVTAFALTLIFIVFEMQAYTIPTGSMADTLKGAHFRLRCPQCGYRYDYDFLTVYYKDYKVSRNATPRANVPVRPSEPRCPSCGYYLVTGGGMSAGGYYVQAGEKMPVVKGDRIFVLKCIYQFMDPSRWDVVVFKNPLNPRENYIKRMIATPGETVEIIDGDVYIDGRMARKPAKVQEEFWMCVYDNDYRPIAPQIRRFNEHTWRQPFKNQPGSQWNFDGSNPGKFTLDSPTGKVHTIVYDTNVGNDFRAIYAYGNSRYYRNMPTCSDLMVRFYVEPDSTGIVGAGLSKYRVEYRGWIDFSGEMVLEKVIDRERLELKRLRINTVDIDEPVEFRFANVDRQLILEFGDEKLKYDLGLGRGDAGQRRTDIMPEAAIFGTGKLALSRIGIFRDIHYMTYSAESKERKILRAREGESFRLGKDEFFVLGDNSPHSLDCRWWDKPGTGNNGREYRQGTVPRDYLVGKAFFVYWPGPFKPFAEWPRVIPCVGGMKIIYGGDY
jgi:signal peptidase I